MGHVKNIFFGGGGFERRKASLSGVQYSLPGGSNPHYISAGLAFSEHSKKHIFINIYMQYQRNTKTEKTDKTKTKSCVSQRQNKALS